MGFDVDTMPYRGRWTDEFSEQALLSAILSKMIYLNGVDTLNGKFEERDYSLENYTNKMYADRLKHMTETDKIEVVSKENLMRFASRVEGDAAIDGQNGVISIDGHNTCGFVESVDLHGKRTLNIVFRGTELSERSPMHNGKGAFHGYANKFRAIHKFFIEDYPHMKRHYQSLRPAVESAVGDDRILSVVDDSDPIPKVGSFLNKQRGDAMIVRSNRDEGMFIRTGMKYHSMDTYLNTMNAWVNRYTTHATHCATPMQRGEFFISNHDPLDDRIEHTMGM